jgi:hypothetical protein
MTALTPSGQYPAKLQNDPTGRLWKVSADIVESIQRRGNFIEIVVLEIGVDVRGHGDRRVAHGLLK